MNIPMAQMKGTANELKSVLTYAKVRLEKPQYKTNVNTPYVENHIVEDAFENNSKEDRILELPGGLRVQKTVLYNRISATDFKKYTSGLLTAVFNRDILATHSLQGRKSSNGKVDHQKPPLPSEALANLIEHIKIKFGVDASLIRAAKRMKLNNKDEMLKKRLNTFLNILRD
ncbi:uncharacterized protein LOC117964105 isoform X2 [Acipenser ruthenus]|nr:uncharacterized protein LOC117964105 isoform X2 [Acipenser ruthenus]XP_058844689.1 uncharacterized protein LOC117964105 isoform X2 [Acipenser ruthenus]XP_058844690.1 uncharacterized protein LOC117964105 isoform X2 [Acipenser ruthenus]